MELREDHYFLSGKKRISKNEPKFINSECDDDIIMHGVFSHDVAKHSGCKVCGQIFSRSDSVHGCARQRYKKVAIGKKIRLDCSECEKTFFHYSSILRHINSKHLGIRFTCNICEKEFTQEARLKTHNCVIQPFNLKLRNVSRGEHVRRRKIDPFEIAYNSLPVYPLLNVNWNADDFVNGISIDSAESLNAELVEFGCVPTTQSPQEISGSWDGNEEQGVLLTDPSSVIVEIGYDDTLPLPEIEISQNGEESEDNLSNESIKSNFIPLLGGDNFEVEKLEISSRKAPAKTINIANSGKKSKISGKKDDGIFVASGDSLKYASKGFDCTDCDKSFTSRYILTRHIQSRHLGIRFRCEMCKKEFTQESRLKNHFCRKQASDNLNFRKKRKINKKVASKPRIIELPSADKEGPYLGKEKQDNWLKIGRKTSENVSSRSAAPNIFENNAITNPISYPEISMPISSILKKKGQIPTQYVSKGFDCTQCEKSFSSKFILTRHVQSTHQGIRFSCDLCDKTFTQKYNLKDHSCKKKFNGVKSNAATKTKGEGRNDKEDVIEVEFNSRKSRPFNCKKCRKSFTSRFNLNRHSEAVHSQMKLTCKLCGKVHLHISYLKKHFRRVHPEIFFLLLNENFDVLSNPDQVEIPNFLECGPETDPRSVGYGSDDYWSDSNYVPRKRAYRARTRKSISDTKNDSSSEIYDSELTPSEDFKIANKYLSLLEGCDINIEGDSSTLEKCDVNIVGSLVEWSDGIQDNAHSSMLDECDINNRHSSALEECDVSECNSSTLEECDGKIGNNAPTSICLRNEVEDNKHSR